MADFVKAVSVSKPHEKAPDFVIATGSFTADKMQELIQQIGTKKYLNWQINKSAKGSYYMVVNDYKKAEL